MLRRHHSEPNYNAEPEPTPTCPNRFCPPPPPRLWGCKTALRLTALALLLATLAVVAGGLLGAPRAGEAAFVPQTTTDYDTDDDGLIDITTLAQLDAIRYDLDGNGIIADADDAAAYLRAFPGRKTDAPNANGCDSDDNLTPTPSVCIGYELMNNLDFDENGDGMITAAGDPTYWDDGKGWMPISQLVISGAASQSASFGLVAYYTATFEGNGHSISNLHINRAIDGDQNLTFAALFAALSGRIRNVDLRNPQITFRRAGTIGNDAPPFGAPPGTPPLERRLSYVGGLAGLLGTGGRIDGARIVGGGVTFTQGAGRHSSVYVGCLAGRGSQGAISGSAASCAVNIYHPQRGGVGGETQFGGDGIPRDTNFTWSGGLLGYSLGAHITASYAAGDVSCHQDGNQYCGGLVGEAVIANIVSSYATGNVVNRYAITSYSSHDRLIGAEVQACQSWSGTPYSTGALVGRIAGGGITDSYATGRVTVPEGVRAERCPFIKAGGLAGNSQAALGSVNPGSITNSYWDRETTTYDYIGSGRVNGPDNGISMVGAHTTAELQMPTAYGATSSARYFEWNRDVDNDANTGDASGNDDPWDFGGAGDYPALKYGRLDVGPQRLRAHAGARQQVYSGSRVTLDGSGSGVLKGSGSGVLRSGAAVTHAWTQTGANAAAHRVTLAGANTARPTFTAPTGLTEDTTLEFTLTVGKTGQTYTATDTVKVRVQAVLPNQLLSLSLADPEGDAVSLAPSFVSSTYNYRASVPNQIASVTLTPAALGSTTLTLNGAAVSSGAGVEVPLKYRGNEITIVVTPPGLEDGADGDGDSNGDGDAEVTPCDEENVGGKACTYTVTVRRAVPPRLAFVPRSLTIDEGGTGTYTVELDTRILTGAVTIAIASDNPDVTVSPTEVTLKPLDMAPRTITVTAASDDDRDDENVVITHTANGAHYYDVIATVGVTVNDTTPEPALSVSAATLALVEGGQGSYTVALGSAPDGDVAVSIASDNPDVTAMPAALAFTPDDWDTAQWVTVSAASDNDAAADTATLTHTASGGGYDDAPAARLAVSVSDDDRAGLAIAPDEVAITENGLGVFRVTLGTQPTANVTVAIASDNADVSARPAALVFTPANWDTGQAVSVSARVDEGSGDELATVRLTAQGGGYDGLRGNVLVSVDDRLAPVIVTTRPGAPAGVSVYGPAGSAARATVAPPAADTPAMATGAGFGIGTAVGVTVTRGPAVGLEVCLPVADALRMDSGAAALTLLRFAGGAWTELAGARDLGDRVCAGGATGEASYAAGYALRPGTVLDLAASVGDTPGTIALSWTPPAAGTSQVAVVVNATDDTDYCLDTLAGIEASSYTCAGRTAGQTYVALLIVLLPDGGYTLANIVRFELPAAAAGGQ